MGLSIGSGTPTTEGQSRPADLAHELTEGFAGCYIRRKACLLVGKAGITESDRPDLEQALTLALLERLARFDPSRANWHRFVATVVERHAAMILKSLHTKKRAGACRTSSLSSPAVDAEGGRTELSQLIEPRHQSAVTAHYGRTESEVVELRSDVVEVVASLPLPWKQLCFWLQHDAVVETARRARRSRSTVYLRLARVRKAFRRAGLGDSFENS